MGNNLIIVSDYIDKNSFFKKYQDKTDVLALTPIAISWFDNEKIPYLTIEDFYDTKQYCSDLKQIYLETEQVFKRLDQVCEKSIGFPHAYTGNINYFLELLADTYYLEKLSQKINKEYSRVFLFGIRSQKKLKWGSLKFSDIKA